MNHHYVGKRQTQKARDHNHTVDRTKRYVLIFLTISLMCLASVASVHAQPSVQTLAASDITDTSAVLNGNVMTNMDETYWWFESIGNCPATPGHFSASGVPGNVWQPVSCQMSQLEPGSIYSFFLYACWGSGGQISGGDCAQGSTLTFTTKPSAGPTPPGFEFALSVSPSVVSVVQGGTAHYAASVTYSAPSYAGTMINIQLTGLGPGMDYNLLQNGDLTVTTSPMTPTESYSIVLTGSANGVTHQTGLTLIVTSAHPATTAVITTTVPSTAPATTPAVITTPTVVVTSVITQTASVQSSSASTQRSTSDVMSLLQQNSLLIIGILVIALVALFLSGRRRSASQVTQTQAQTNNATYCPHCGTQNTLTNSYCKKCGAKLR